MRYKLYKINNEVKTFQELKADYAEKVNAELPIDDDAMQLIIDMQLIQNGGCIEMINDDVLQWCNDYTEYVEADRGMLLEEIEDSVKEIYLAIKSEDRIMRESVEDNLFEGDELSVRLKKISCRKEIENGIK